MPDSDAASTLSGVLAVVAPGMGYWVAESSNVVVCVIEERGWMQETPTTMTASEMPA